MTELEFPHHEPTESLLARLRERGPGWVVLQNIESNGRDSIALRHVDDLDRYPNSRVLTTYEEVTAGH
jgi:hypothetical protein